jgi:RNA polymerase sigma-70 factor (ECF subfamily)
MVDDLSLEDTKGISLLEEKSLIEAAYNDSTAFNRLYLSYIRPIYRYIFSRVGDTNETEDLTAQVFLAAFEGLPRYHHDGHFAAWLFSIARHKVADFFRSKRLELPIEVVNKEFTRSSDQLSTIIQTEETKRMSALIHKLNEKDQEILRLRFVAELSFAEIARLVNSNTEETKKRVYRLLARLKKQLELDHD